MIRRRIALGLACGVMACGALAVATNGAELVERCAELAAATEDSVVRGQDGWLFLRGELRHIGVGKFWGDEAVQVSRSSKPEHADPLPAILDTHRQFKELGIRLIVVPVPPKAVIYPDKIVPKLDWDKTTRLDPSHQEFYRILGEKGVEVIDPAPAFLTARTDKDPALYCRQDTHWSGRACVLVADLLAKELKKEEWYKAAPKSRFTATNMDISIDGDLKIMLKDESIPQEKLNVRKIDLNKKPVEADAGSPVLLMGDSHCLVYQSGGDMLATSSGLASQLAMELQLPIDWIGVRGSGARPARIQLFRRGRKPGYLDSKKVVIWCFSAREFTEASGWGKIPVTK